MNNKKSTLVSIIVPCYNQAIYLSETLDSVLNQIYNNWECIIVNDGSTDNTKDVALSYCNRDSRFLYIEQENAGLSAARNAGVIRSRGEFILPLDSDDKIAPAYIYKAVECFEKDDSLKIVYCRAAFLEKDMESGCSLLILLKNCWDKIVFFVQHYIDVWTLIWSVGTS